MATARASVDHGGWNRPWGSAVMVQIYRVIVVGVLCSQISLASLVRTPYEVNTSLLNTKNPLYTLRL